MDKIRLVIVEDEDLILKSLKIFFDNQLDITLVNIYANAEDLLNDLPYQQQVNTILLDIGLPGISGIEAIPKIKELNPHIDILMLTSYEDSDRIFASLKAGATAYISKKTAHTKIKEALFIVNRGGSFMSPFIAKKVVQHFVPQSPTKTKNLTKRQSQIVEAIVKGHSYKMVADELSITLDTVRDHIKKIYRVLEINCKLELVQKHLKGDL